MHTCNKCHTEKPTDAFYKRSGGGLRRDCKGCCKSRENTRRAAQGGDENARVQRERYRSNPETILSERRALVEKKKLHVTLTKLKPCADCHRYFSEVAMDFDHVPERGKKLAGISRMVQGSYSLQTVIDEIAKCDLVCACCHRVRSATRQWTREHKRVRIGRWPKVA